jgi:hypothetical protein
MWDSTLTDEFFVAVREFNLSWDELRTLGHNSLAFSFLADREKRALLERLDERFTDFEARIARRPQATLAADAVSYGFPVPALRALHLVSGAGDGRPRPARGVDSVSAAYCTRASCAATDNRKRVNLMSRPSQFFLVAGVLVMLAACGAEPPGDGSAPDELAPIPVKAVVVTMFEIGEDTGDQAAEFQLWKERRNLDTVFPFPPITTCTSIRRTACW